MSNPLLLTLQLMFGVTSKKKIGKYKLGRLLQYTCRQILSSSILNPTELTDICRVVYKSVQNCIVANTCKLPTPPLEFVKEPRRKQWNIFLVPLGNDYVLTESLYMYLPLYLKWVKSNLTFSWHSGFEGHKFLHFLSHFGKKKNKNLMSRPGFEPTKARLEGHCANHYTTDAWW